MQRIIIIVGIIFAFPVAAEQGIWVTKQSADKAVELINSAQSVKYYCAPCNDENIERVEVNSVKVIEQKPLPEKTLSMLSSINGIDYTGANWSVLVNDKEIDFAYTYLPLKGGWENLAMTLGLTVSSVPALIDSTGQQASALNCKQLYQGWAFNNLLEGICKFDGNLSYRAGVVIKSSCGALISKSDSEDWAGEVTNDTFTDLETVGKARFCEATKPGYDAAVKAFSQANGL